VPGDARGVRGVLRALGEASGDTYALALVRTGFGVLFVNEAWLATQQLRAGGFFGEYFHQPMLPGWLVVSETGYLAVLAAQWAAGILAAVGRAARPALVVCAALLVYTMLCDRLQFHHYRHTMAAFGTLLAFSPCDRQLSLGRPNRTDPGPLWAAQAMKAQVSVMYLASGGSKLFDPDWRGGLMMREMVRGFGGLLQGRGLPSAWVERLQTPIGSSLLAKGAIATELALAVLLWWPRSRRLGLWIGLGFHLSISFLTPVRLFTAEMLLVYLLFATPDRQARTLRVGRRHAWLGSFVESFDWLARYQIERANESSLIDRGGEELRGARLASCLSGTIPILFPVWPVVALWAHLGFKASRRTS
jgi:hypothetical protein